MPSSLVARIPQGGGDRAVAIAIELAAGAAAEDGSVEGVKARLSNRPAGKGAREELGWRTSTMRPLVRAVLLLATVGSALARSKSRPKNVTMPSLWRGDAFTGRRSKTLYGTDDRLEESEVSDSDVLGVGAATAAIVPARYMSFNSASRTWSWSQTCESFASHRHRGRVISWCCTWSRCVSAC